jgi:hypothetical protein
MSSAVNKALRVIREQADEIERLQQGVISLRTQYDELADKNQRLRELTENDGKEIGSYREGTGLRGENQRLRAALERIEVRGIEIISERVGGSDASYVAQELTAIAREALREVYDE